MRAPLFAIAALCATGLTRRHHERDGWRVMSQGLSGFQIPAFDVGLGLAVALVLLVYLMAALLAPERF
jgi:K+-transporting ATPase KdpF subunit